MAITAQHYYSGFDLAHDTYNALSTASDGKIYYVLSSESISRGGQVCVYDPETEEIKILADLTDICGEADLKAIPQGKSHASFYESKGKLYFSTHVGYYELIDGMDRLPRNPPNGYKAYPGGHILSYNLSNGKFEDLAIIPDGEGMVTMVMDPERECIYGITWPSGNFIYYDIRGNSLRNLGPVSEKGEAGTPGRDFRALCRSMFIDPKDGSVYFSTSEGDIYTFHPDMTSFEKLENIHLRLDYFGQYDPTMPGSMGYNWRQMKWYPPEKVAYGIHGNSGYLFRFDPRKQSIELVERITSGPSRKSGMYDQFSYGYLGFDLGPNNTLYYLTGGPIDFTGQRNQEVKQIAKGAAKGLENLHLVTFNLPDRKYTDHGPIFYKDGSRPTYVNSIALSKNGDVYTLARFKNKGKIIQDLVKIPGPFLE
ncbi:MAG: hypothetical protein WEB89_11235 [Balneolales bacterium]